MVQSCWSHDPLDRPSFLQLALEIEGGAGSHVVSAGHAVTMISRETGEDAPPETQRGGGGDDTSAHQEHIVLLQAQIIQQQAQIKQLRAATKLDGSRAALGVGDHS